MKFQPMKIEGLSIIKKHRQLFVLVFIFTFFSLGLEMISIGSLIPLLNVIFAGQATSGQNGWIVNNLCVFLDRFPKDRLFFWICVFFLIITIVKVFCKSLRDIYRTVLTQRILVGCQKTMFEKTINSDLRYFIENQSGDLVFRIMTLPREVSAYFTVLPSIFVESVNVIFLSILLWSVSAQLFWMVAGLGFIYSLAIRWSSKNLFERMGKDVPETIAWQNIITNESLGGIREIITYGKRQEWIKRFEKQCQRYYDLRIRISTLRLIPGNTLELVVIGLICGLGIFLGNKPMNEFISSVPVLAVYGMALTQMIPSFARVGQDRIQLASEVPAIRLFEKIQESPTVHRKEAGQTFISMKEQILFKDVSFFYRKGHNVFHHLNLVIPRNKTIAVVGGSGAGKSTLIDLLLGLYDVEEGTILIDGVDLKEYSASSWRKKIGVVAQNSFVFNASVKENIAFDLEHVDMEKVIASSKATGAHEFISQLKNGYDTLLGDRGYTLSGGQRQRIAIARALYRDPEIIIFDEATSALDNRTEDLISQTINSLTSNKTIIILAHRLSTIQKADIIYVLKDGQVAQSGTHEELIRQKGEYVDLYQKKI